MEFQQLFTLTLNALLNPLAKNPPNGAINELKSERTMEWNCIGYSQTSSCVKPPYKQNMQFSTQLWISTNNNWTKNFVLHCNQLYKQTFHDKEKFTSMDSRGHVHGGYLVVESLFLVELIEFVFREFTQTIYSRQKALEWLYLFKNWRLTNPRKYLTGAGMVKAVSLYRAEGSQVILKSVTEPLNWCSKRKFTNVRQ